MYDLNHASFYEKFASTQKSLDKIKCLQQQQKRIFSKKVALCNLH